MSNKKCCYTENMGERLREYRKSKGWKLVELAENINISHGSLSNLENNKTKPSAETLASLVCYTDIDIEWLLTGQRSKEPQHRSEDVQSCYNFELLTELEEWLLYLVKEEPFRKDWFTGVIFDTFKDFKEWRVKREQETAEGYKIGASQNAA